jgi:hypothetical protein
MGVEIPMNLQYNGGPRMLNILVPDDNMNSWYSLYKSVASYMKHSCDVHPCFGTSSNPLGVCVCVYLTAVARD